MDFDPYHPDQPHLVHESDDDSPGASAPLNNPPAGGSLQAASFHPSYHDPRVEHTAIGWLVPTLIVGFCLAGVVVALGHHLMLQSLNGRSVANYSQFWVKNASNAFGNIVHWLLTASVTYSLMQTIWYYVRHSAFTLPDLDNLFGLPSPISASRLLTSAWAITLLPIVMMALVTQATALIAILAPNALEVAPAPLSQQTIAVPTLQLSSGMIYSMVSDDACTYYDTTQLWQRTVQRAVISDRDVSWSAPAECNVSCHYTVDYNAPALQCADLTPAQIWDPSHPGTPPAQPMAVLQNQNSLFLTGIFNATSNIGLLASDPSSNSSSPYTLIIAYQSLNDTVIGREDAAGSFCTFYDATYRATVSFHNNTQTVSVAVLSYQSPVNNSYVAPSDCREYGDDIEPPAGLAHSVNYHAMCELFVQIFEGNITDRTINNVGELLINTNIGLTNLFSINQTVAHWSFTPVANLSQSLADLFTNVTLAFVSSSTATANVSAMVGSTNVIWVYDSRKLWTIYGLGFLVALVCGGIGMACLVANGSPGSRDFSHLLVATRNPHLDAVVADLAGSNQRGKEKTILLQYGSVGDSSSPSRVAFGVVGVDNINPVNGMK